MKTMINPINKCGVFDTPTSYADLLQWCEQLSGGEKTAAITAAHMALNLAHHIIATRLGDEVDVPEQLQ